ncbi:MAG: uncharacterized protein KVP18_002549 [Porospora cf. gigantea A]|uniref:uncharacterized protein n=2 Tax=Porospora cf. gigantea A TaxID=2853593 RepID=UPI00355AC37C|nr:MAG: hypothetical protein KVP18_002549 [Porospora cf. gigantea A]
MERELEDQRARAERLPLLYDKIRQDILRKRTAKVLLLLLVLILISLAASATMIADRRLYDEIVRRGLVPPLILISMVLNYILSLVIWLAPAYSRRWPGSFLLAYILNSAVFTSVSTGYAYWSCDAGLLLTSLSITMVVGCVLGIIAWLLLPDMTQMEWIPAELTLISVLLFMLGIAAPLGVRLAACDLYALAMCILLVIKVQQLTLPDAKVQTDPQEYVITTIELHSTVFCLLGLVWLGMYMSSILGKRLSLAAQALSSTLVAPT